MDGSGFLSNVHGDYDNCAFGVCVKDNHIVDLDIWGNFPSSSDMLYAYYVYDWPVHRIKFLSNENEWRIFVCEISDRCSGCEAYNTGSEVWVPYLGKCYYFGSTKITYDEAHDSCRALNVNATLATPRVEHEILWIRYTASVLTQELWVGLCRYTGASDVKWDDGSPALSTDSYDIGGDLNGDDKCYRQKDDQGSWEVKDRGGSDAAEACVLPAVFGSVPVFDPSATTTTTSTTTTTTTTTTPCVPVSFSKQFYKAIR